MGLSEQTINSDQTLGKKFVGSIPALEKPTRFRFQKLRLGGVAMKGTTNGIRILR
jgi:hypothetical protein